ARTAEQFEPFEIHDYSVDDAYRAQQETYDAGWNPLIELEQQTVWPLIPAAAPGQRALDAACGTGRHALQLGALGYETGGFDSSAEMIEVARGKLPAADFRVAPLEALPFETAWFAVAVCALALALCADIAQPIAELGRVTREGGRLIISDVHPMSVMLGGSL